jgi:hypothetical protein
VTADEWNALYPVGTPVMAYPGVRPEHPLALDTQRRRDAGNFVDPRDADLCQALETTTRSRAWTLGHGSPVVVVSGYGGGICLTHVDPLPVVPRCPDCGGTFEDCTCGGAA